MNAVDKVIPYYTLIVRDLFQDKKGASETFSRLLQKFNELFKGHFGFTPQGDLQQRMLLHAIRFLVRNNAVTVVNDDFAPEFLIWSIKGVTQFTAITPAAQLILDKIGKIGRLDHNRFLFEAIRGFESKHRKDAAEYLDDFELAFSQSDDLHETDTEATDDFDLDEETWTPLKIERESSEAKDAIEKTEVALKEIEQSNGYAASESEERNGIVATIRGTLDSIKTGSPSRGAVISGLLAPLKFIAKKFSEASIGEAAKIAVIALIKWLF